MLLATVLSSFVGQDIAGYHWPGHCRVVSARLLLGLDNHHNPHNPNDGGGLLLRVYVGLDNRNNPDNPSDMPPFLTIAVGQGVPEVVQVIQGYWGYSGYRDY
jgi:hypothetical protein